MTKWSELTDFMSVLEEWEELAGSFSIVQPGSDTYRTAGIGSRFCKHQGFQRLRLAPNDRPDLEVETPVGIRAFEITESDIPGRRRSAEYKADRKLTLAGQSTVREDRSPALLREHAFSMLVAASEKKAALGYGPDCGLIIYLNPGDFDWYHQEIVEQFVPGTAAAGSAFRDVWVFWKDVAYRTWAGGAPNLPGSTK